MLLFIKLFWFCFIFHRNRVFSSVQASPSAPEVDTLVGKVRGEWRTSMAGRKFAAFEGIPYALPPVGDLRFEEPQPFGSWSGTWHATRVHRCLQRPDEYDPAVIGDEDCLYLNIYVPTDTMDFKKKIQVVMGFHGGGFKFGSGYDMIKPEFVTDRELIFVAFNFRQGFFVILGDDAPPKIDTPMGKIRGSWRTSMGGRKFASFEGIPYVKPPVGELRFEEPQPADCWTDTLEATKLYTCIQRPEVAGESDIVGDEDCLYLNVYIPTDTMDLKKRFEVIVNIHGGGFRFGSSGNMVTPELVMDRDFIFVSFNYRLGFLGFLSTEDSVIPGNNGMKDQVMAMRWVKHNIAHFGGNPDNVTITGLSAGGTCVHLHYFSPMSKGLFARGMSQSGAALHSWAVKTRQAEIARRLGTLLGCEGGSSVELKKCLKKKPAYDMVAMLDTFYAYRKTPVAMIGPVVERNSTNPFLVDFPYSLIQRGKVHDLPWIASSSPEEGILPAIWFYRDLEDIDADWAENARYILDYNYTLPVAEHKKVAMEIKDFYLGPGEHINKKNFKKFVQMLSDRLFISGIEYSAKLQSIVNKSPVYYYYFNYLKGENKGSLLYADIELEGSAHAVDGIYFYGIVLFKNFSTSDTKLKNACQDMLYSFATTGKPSFDGTDKWLPTKGSILTYLNVTDVDDIKLQTTKSFFPEYFWAGIGLLEY